MLVQAFSAVRSQPSSCPWYRLKVAAGLTLGRVALLWVNQKVGERKIIFVYLLLGIGWVHTAYHGITVTLLIMHRLELTIWFIPSLIENAVAVSLVGMMLGPMYPIVMSQSGRIIPRKVCFRISQHSYELTQRASYSLGPSVGYLPSVGPALPSCHL